MGRDPLTPGETLLATLKAIHEQPRRLQSNFVRDRAYEVARLASAGCITTAIDGAFGHFWRVTFTGLRVLELESDE